MPSSSKLKTPTARRIKERAVRRHYVRAKTAKKKRLSTKFGDVYLRAVLEKAPYVTILKNDYGGEVVKTDYTSIIKALKSNKKAKRSDIDIVKILRGKKKIPTDYTDKERAGAALFSTISTFSEDVRKKGAMLVKNAFLDAVEANVLKFNKANLKKHFTFSQEYNIKTTSGGAQEGRKQVGNIIDVLIERKNGNIKKKFNKHNKALEPFLSTKIKDYLTDPEEVHLLRLKTRRRHFYSKSTKNEIEKIFKKKIKKKKGYFSS